MPTASQEAVSRTRRLGRTMLPLGVLFLAVGVSMAMTAPFLSLFLSTAVHAGPVRVSVFLVASPVAGVIASTVIGRISDRWAIRRAVLIGTSVAGLISMTFTALVREYWILLALAVTGAALAVALFPQVFAYARQTLARYDSSRTAMGVTGLRTVFSLAWVGGPPLAVLLLEVGGFTYVYGAAAAMYALAAMVAIFWLDEVEPPAEPVVAADDDGAVPAVPEAVEASRWTLLLTTVAFTLLQCPLTLCVQALPLFISTDLHGDVSDAGIILGLCAGLEIPLMLGLGGLTARIRLRPLVLAGAGCGVAYYGLATGVSSVWALAVAQIVDAVFIAAVSGLGISYMQDMLPRQPGRATTLFTNSFPVGAILAGPLFGLAQHFGYRLAFAVGAALCTAGLLLLLATGPKLHDGRLP